MCGRVVSTRSPDELARYFTAEVAEGVSLPTNHNVAPTSDIYVVVEGPDGVRRVDAFHWGLVPVWANDLKVGNRMINARAETVATSNAFKHALSRKRCIVPVDGFYEWRAIEGQKRKQPMYITRLDGEPLAFAGLWETWRGPKDASLGEVLYSTAIVTTSANGFMSSIHDRMPVILPPPAWNAWLDPGRHDVAELSGLLVPAPEGLLQAHPVSTAVNDVRNNGAELIEPAEPIPTAGTLLEA